MTKSQHVFSVDLIRFGPAVLVVLFHYTYWSWASQIGDFKELYGGTTHYPASFWFGWIGVEILFVISGYVILYSVKNDAWGFIRSRFLRLYPAVLICAPLSAIILAALNVYPLHKIAWELRRTLAFWPNGPWVDGVYWTLGIEVAFYALIAGTLLIGRRDRLAVVLSIVGLASTIYWIVTLMSAVRSSRPAGRVSSS